MRERSDRALLERVRQLHAASRRTYGSPRIYRDLRADGVAVGRKRVERLMRQDGLSGAVKHRRGQTTIRVPGVRVADDLVKRDFQPPAPNQLWVADITYLRTWQGWLYLAVVVDCYSRRVVGWALEDNLRAELVVDALEQALQRRRPGRGPSTIPTKARNMSRSPSAAAAVKQASSNRWAAAEAPTTTPSANRSSRP